METMSVDHTQGVSNTFLDLFIGHVRVPSPFFDNVAQ
jgi:hypothetical protein